MKRFFFLLILFLQAVVLPKNSEAFEAGNRAYRKAAYEEALQQYLRVEKSGLESPALYYNMGNSYFRLGKTGKAILYFERAYRLAPNDDDIRHNLAFVRTYCEDRIDVVPQFFLFVWLQKLVGFLSADIWFLFLLISLSLTAALIISFLVSNTLNLRRKLALGVLASLTVSLFVAAVFTARVIADNQTDRAVLIEHVVNVKYSPEHSSKNAFILHEGVKVKLEESVDHWVQIRLDDGKTGWVLKNTLETI